VDSEIARLSLELDTLKKQVAHLFTHLGIEYRPPEEAHIVAARALKAGGKEIDAINAVREATGLGLAESKMIVDSL
jgi:ribosomal protein L7/L12